MGLMTYTFQDKIRNKTYYEVLDIIGDYWSRISRKLFVDLAYRKKSRKDLKKAYIKEYGILARQFNSMYNHVQGLIDSRLALLEEEIVDKMLKIDMYSFKIKRFQGISHDLGQLLNDKSQKDSDFVSLVDYRHKIKSKIHGLKIKRQKYIDEIPRLKKDLQDKRPRVCFGTKKLFSKQFKSNGLSHMEWLQMWRESRSHMFFCLGSKDETCGNQNCQFDDRSLKLRLIPKFDDLGEKGYLIIDDVDFNYGHEQVSKCACHYGYRLTKSYKIEKLYQSVSYRFIRKKDTWYVHASIEIEETPEVTSPFVGALGIDFNVNHVNMYHVDRFGNPISHQNLKYQMYNKSTNQVTDILNQVADAIVNYALEHGLMVVIENLDFKHKKLFLQRKPKKYRRMLSNFPYKKYTDIIKSKCSKHGVALSIVNPKNTSVKGKRIMKRLGCSSHDGAAYIIGRRGLGYK